MAISCGGAHDEVPPHTSIHPRTHSSGVCRCGAVFDFGNVAVPAEYSGMCGRCAFKRGLRLSTINAARPLGSLQI